MDDRITEHGLQGTFAYMDNITVCGDTQESHDENLDRFYKMLEIYELVLNTEKSIISVKEIRMLGYYLISEGLKT